MRLDPQYCPKCGNRAYGNPVYKCIGQIFDHGVLKDAKYEWLEYECSWCGHKVNMPTLDQIKTGQIQRT